GLRRHRGRRGIHALPDVQLQHLVRPVPVRPLRRLRRRLPGGRHPHGRHQPAEVRGAPVRARRGLRLAGRRCDDPRRGALHPLRTLCQALPVRRHYDGAVRAPGDLDRRPALQGVVPGRAARRHARCRRRIGSLSFLERVDQTIRRSPVWRSLFRNPYPTDERSRAYAVMNNVFLHLHPVRVRQHAVKFAYTFCLGGLSFFLFLVLTVTGVYLMFFYVPSSTSAYSDILSIQTRVAFGLLTRNVHRWGAHLMVFFVFLHMMRVFYHGAYKPPREFNWVVGVLLLFFTIALSFTGYLLPWDQISFWAITIGLNMASYTPLINTPIQALIFGGLEVGQNTLLRFYVLHIMVLPLVAAILLAVHFWRIRKDGGISGPL